MSTTIDLLLADYAREIDCYMRVRDASRTLGLRLTAAIEQYLQHRDDAELLNQARALRQLYGERRTGVDASARDWVRTRGSSGRLARLASEMSGEQRRTFAVLSARDAELSDERAEYEALTLRLRGLLLLFEEVVV